MNSASNIINHIGFVLDASDSMRKHAANLIKVVDGQVKHMALRSQELEQETRVSLWTFSNATNIQCVVWDMDVLRLPSIANFYQTNGMTAFIDASLKSIADLSETPERYGNHSFLLYVVTDGEENASNARPEALQKRLETLPEHWTVAALVPNATGKHEAKRFGFPAGNIEIWDATSQQGVHEVGERVRQATDNYMLLRRDGIRSTTSLFSTDARTVNSTTIKQANLKPLPRDSYMLVPVPKDTDIKSFTEDCGRSYRVGNGFYELMKTETIQPNKKIAVVERGPKAQVYVGADARSLIGLPDMIVRVKPDYNPDYAVFVQSTSNNRKLIAHTRYLYVL